MIQKKLEDEISLSFPELFIKGKQEVTMLFSDF